MPIRVDVDDRGTRILIADLAQAASGIEGRIADVHESVGPTIVRTAKRSAPVDTGTLRRSIDYSVNRRKQALRIGALRRFRNPRTGQLAASYLPYVHDGTSRMPPRPFIRNAIRRHSGPGSKLIRGYQKAGVTPIDRRVVF